MVKPERSGEVVAPASVSVQSVTRAFRLLDLLADEGGSLSLTELAASTGLPAPTIHRLMRSLVAGGHVRQEASRRYALGPRLIRLGEVAGQALGSWAKPYLAELVQRIGETANLALLEADSVVYVAQVPSPHAMRMFTEVGRHVMPHSTGVGKALLSCLDDAEAVRIVRGTGMPARTESTITSEPQLLAELHAVRSSGYAVDNEEQEVCVRCVAVPVAINEARIAVSVSGPSARLTSERVPHIAGVLASVAERMAASDLSA